MWYETYDGKLLNLNQFDVIIYNQKAIEFWKDGKVIEKDETWHIGMTYGRYIALKTFLLR